MEENIRNRKSLKSVKDVTGIKESEIIWHKIAKIDDTNGKTGVWIILFLNLRPRIFTASEFNILFEAEDNSIIEI